MANTATDSNTTNVSKETEIIKSVLSGAEKISGNERKRFDASRPVGSISVQGDVYLMVLKGLPKGAKKRDDLQVAEGSTRGSRHVLSNGTEVWDVPAAELRKAILEIHPDLEDNIRYDSYLGPVFRGGPEQWLTHPDHAWQGFDSPDTYVAVIFQRNMTADAVEERAGD